MDPKFLQNVYFKMDTSGPFIAHSSSCVASFLLNGH